jgi:hypothetical protein
MLDREKCSLERLSNGLILTLMLIKVVFEPRNLNLNHIFKLSGFFLFFVFPNRRVNQIISLLECPIFLEVGLFLWWYWDNKTLLQIVCYRWTPVHKET